MPQIFHPSANAFSRVSIFGAVFFVAAAVGILALFLNSSYITREDVAIEQPVPFSHQLHVSNLGLDCRYCHPGVETSSFADIPPVHTCMTCHSQIWTQSALLEPVRTSYQTGAPLEWVRVNDLADFVYFDHSIHVAKGVGCETCHGQVDQMPLTWKESSLFMQWCLDCHRAPEKYVRPVEEIFTSGYQPPEDQLTLGRRLVEEYGIADADALDDCTVCHR